MTGENKSLEKRVSELERLLEESKEKASYYQKIAEDSEKKRLREINLLSELISDRKYAEETLRQSEEKYRQLADLLPQSVFETDRHGILTFANRHAFETFGYTEDDFKKGLNAIQMLAPQDQKLGLDQIKKIMKGEKKQRGRNTPHSEKMAVLFLH